MFDLEHKLCLDDSIFEIPKIEKFEVENVQFILCLIYVLFSIPITGGETLRHGQNQLLKFYHDPLIFLSMAP